MEKLCFLRVLRNKEFTYALFDQLAEDFNGDTFPVDDEEHARVQQVTCRSSSVFWLANRRINNRSFSLPTVSTSSPLN